MSKRFIITEDEKNNIKKLYNINEQGAFDIVLNAANDYVQTQLNKPGGPTFDTPSNSNTSGTKVPDSSLPNKTTSDDDFYKGILKCIGAQPTKSNMLFMYAWRQAEGGGSANNPFNTTQPWPGATVLKGSSAGVKNYKTPEDGIQATCKTLKNGRYQKIIDGFKNDVGLSALTDSVVDSKWGTKDLLGKITKGYIAGNTPKPHPINPTEVA
jgi:hypothetical protein